MLGDLDLKDTTIPADTPYMTVVEVTDAGDHWPKTTRYECGGNEDRARRLATILTMLNPTKTVRVVKLFQ